MSRVKYAYEVRHLPMGRQTSPDWVDSLKRSITALSKEGYRVIFMGDNYFIMEKKEENK